MAYVTSYIILFHLGHDIDNTRFLVFTRDFYIYCNFLKLRNGVTSGFISCQEKVEIISKYSIVHGFHTFSMNIPIQLADIF